MNNSRATKRSWVDLVPILIIIASFGPYVFPSSGLRTEHLLIYPLFLFAFLVLLMQRYPVWCPPPLLGMLVLLLGITLWTLVVPMFGNYPVISFSKYLASIENYTQPIAVIVLVIAFVRYSAYEEYLNYFRRLCRVLIFLLCLNSIVAICSIFLDLSNFIRPFVFSCFGDQSVSQQAASMGRYSGIFNQPFESGLTYSLGLLSWGYLSRVSKKSVFIDYCMLFILIVGGALSVSKVFILGGIPLFFLYWNPIGNFKKYFSWRFFLVALICCCVILWMIKFWEGWGYFCRLFKIKGADQLVAVYSGGRFGAGSTILSEFVRIWQESPLYGFGFGVTSCFDNGYLEFFYQGGIVALLGYSALLGIYFWHSLRNFLKGYEEGRFLLAYFILVIGGNLGATVITINRFSTIFWVLTTFIFLMIQARRKAEAENRIIAKD